MTHAEDRRRKRSADPLIALHYQLSHARQDGSLETIVVADPSGVVVAGAGSWAACEELAAYAPLLAQGVGDSDGPVGSRIASMRHEVEVRHLKISGQEVLLCVRTATATAAREGAIERAAAGVSRILSAA